MSWLDRVLERARAWWSGLWLERVRLRFAACLESEAREAFVELLFQVMSLALAVDPRYRRNIHGYNATYVFRRQDDLVLASVIFAAGRMQVRPGSIADPDVIVTFKDNKVLAQFLFGERADLIGSIVNDELSYVGNLNYLRKLSYMAKRLQLEIAATPVQAPVLPRLPRYRGHRLQRRAV